MNLTPKLKQNAPPVELLEKMAVHGGVLFFQNGGGNFSKWNCCLLPSLFFCGFFALRTSLFIAFLDNFTQQETEPPDVGTAFSVRGFWLCSQFFADTVENFIACPFGFSFFAQPIVNVRVLGRKVFPLVARPEFIQDRAKNGEVISSFAPSGIFSRIEQVLNFFQTEQVFNYFAIFSTIFCR